MQIKTTKELSTLRMSGERAREYTAWLLYCEAGSLEKTLRIWEKISSQVVTDLSPIYREQLGQPVSLRTLKRWCLKYRWVKRRRVKLDEDLKELHKEAQKIAKLRIYKVTKAFGLAMERKLIQLQKGEHVSAYDLKTLWEMHRIEMGLSTSIGKQEVSVINEDEQKPLTPEEEELNRRITEVTKEFYKEKTQEGNQGNEKDSST